MIEQGLVLLIQAGLGSPPIAPGGWALVLPINQLCADDCPMAWTWRAIVSEPNYVLSGQTGWTCLEVQIDCHGVTMAHAITLARAIDGVLRGGYRGTLPDSDHTWVDGIYRLSPFIDGFSDVNHSYVRTLEYDIHYEQL